MSLSLAVVVRGTDDNGKALECEGRTISINRHGAGIEIDQSLAPNQVLQLVNPVSQREAEFRLVGRLEGRVVGRVGGGVATPALSATEGARVYAVMGPLPREAPGGQEYGIQSVDMKIAFWGVYFPPPLLPEAAGGQVNLECLRCGRAQGLRLSIVEVDVLESAGGLCWPCGACGEVTSWGYPEKERARLAGEARPGPSGLPGLDSEDPRGPSSRLPVRIRRASGQVEHAESEEVSKTGFSFSSEVDYEIGEALFVACPENPGGPNAEAPAQIARKHEVRGTGRKIFGVRYAPSGGWNPTSRA